MNSKHRPYTIFVNSTNSFEDTWDPFFQLFATYWPEDEVEVLLNTETKTYSHPDVEVTATRVSAMEPNADLPWGECVERALEYVDTDLILYLQDDYFLEAPVKKDLIDQWAELMMERGYDNIRLVECANAGPWNETEHDLLWEVDQKAEYRISLQAGLWQVDTLKERIRSHESPWQFEVYGSKRANWLKDQILCVNRDRFHVGGPQVVPYTPTGIVKGKWKLDIVEDLFSQHDIDVNFEKRGIYTPDDLPSERTLLDKLTDPNFFEKAIDRLRSAY
jgi:hypothetical protein